VGRLAETALQVVDEGPGRRFDRWLVLEAFGLIAGREPAVLDREAPAFAQVLGLQAGGTEALGGGHAVERGLAGGMHRLPLDRRGWNRDAGRAPLSAAPAGVF
jgi:hypothetical protein